MAYKRVLTVQDISCFGQCSLTVASPVISACGIETCVLPSAVLSTHTMGFDGYTCTDLTQDMRDISRHWARENINFDAIYSGYLADARQIEIVKELFANRLNEDGVRIVDPVMGDFGEMYPAFDSAFADTMRGLCAHADIILPNITEACLLAGERYRESYDEAFVKKLAKDLLRLGVKKVVITGVSYSQESTGVAVFDESKDFYYSHRRINRSCHGTGDLFSSAFTGALLSGQSEERAACIAADFILKCIDNTPASHWYGVRFESCLSSLMKAVGNRE